LADLKPRTVWEITDDAFDLYREHFVLLGGVSAVIFAPALLLLSTAGVEAFGNFLDATGSRTATRDAAIGFAWLYPLLAAAYVTHFGATALAVRDYLTGETPTIISVYKRTFRHFFPLLVIALMVGLLAFISTCTYIGPLLVGAYYSFSAHGIVLEDRRIVDSVKRSRQIAGAYFGKSFGLLCLMGFIALALTGGAIAVVALGFTFVPKDITATPPNGGRSISDYIQLLTAGLMAVLIAPLPAIATTLLYYDLRVRREGLDIESEAQAWDVALAPDPFQGVLNPKIPKPKKGGKK
ncbi:MAG: hypothetical protein H7Y38_18765, partial [Armatimonadetes bacterium]|nr:hypothetical protein [Armatimonadota bacterium]